MSSAAKSFGTCQRLWKKLCGAFLSHIDGDPVFSTSQSSNKLKAFHEQFLKAKDQGVDQNFLLEINFAPKDKLKGELLKHAIDDYHFLLLGTTKQIKSKVSDDSPETNDVTLKLDDRLKRFKIDMQV